MSRAAVTAGMGSQNPSEPLIPPTPKRMLSLKRLRARIWPTFPEKSMKMYPSGRSCSQVWSSKWSPTSSGFEIGKLRGHLHLYAMQSSMEPGHFLREWIHIPSHVCLPSKWLFAHLSWAHPTASALQEELQTAALKVRPGSNSLSLQGALHHKGSIISLTGKALFVWDPRELMRW